MEAQKARATSQKNYEVSIARIFISSSFIEPE